LAERYTSRIALVLGEGVADVSVVVKAAGAAGDIDRASPVRGQSSEAQEVHWGGRMQKAVVRQVRDERDGAHLLRTEAYLGADGLTVGLQRQAQLLRGLARQLRGNVVGVRDLSSATERDEAWMNRLAIGAVNVDDAIVARSEGEGTWWVRTHGAARFDVPDLELYGLAKAQVAAGESLLAHVHEQLLRTGLKTELRAADGTPLYLVPLLEAWQHVPIDWPGVGQAGLDRGPDLDGPRATLSLLHKPRFGRYKRDLDGVVRSLVAV
jgi:hypothetical protein